MRFAGATVSDAFGCGGLAGELVKFRTDVLRKTGRGFAGKTFYLEDDVDYMWHLRILAHRGIVVESSAEADFVVGVDEKAIEIDSDADDNDGDEEAKSKVLARGRKRAAPKRVSVDWLEEMIEGF